MKFKDFPMHGIKTIESEYLSWYQYHKWIRRWYYFLGIPVWFTDLNDEDKPMYEFINRAFK